MKGVNFKHRIDGKKDKPLTKSRFARKSKYKYIHASCNEYSAFLESLDRDDLFRHSVDAGIVPIDNVDLLKKRLVNKFI